MQNLLDTCLRPTKKYILRNIFQINITMNKFLNIFKFIEINLILWNRLLFTIYFQTMIPKYIFSNVENIKAIRKTLNISLFLIILD